MTHIAQDSEMKLRFRRVSSVTLCLIFLAVIFYLLSWFKALAAIGILGFFFEVLSDGTMMLNGGTAQRDDSDDVKPDEARRL